MKQLRRALESPDREGGVAGIEGPNLLAEAIRAGLRIETVFIAEDAEKLIAGLKLMAETEVLLVPRELLARAMTTETPQPVAALVRPPEWTWAHVSPKAKHTPLVMVLAGLQDPGNLGTILRSAEAFGATGVVSLPGTVSAWNPKAVRASAGSVFRVPVLAATAAECFANLRKAGVKIAAAMARAEQSIDRMDLGQATALVIGNEGSGIAKELAAQADVSVTVPCPGPVESLNAAMAASVLLYEASRQRSAQRAQARERRRGAHR